MKNKILKIAFCFVLFTTLLITVSFATTVKESVSDYTAGAYIIGSTRFESNVVITASLAANAGINEAKLNLALGKDISNLKVSIYSYDSDFEEWNEVKEDGTTRLLETSEAKKLENNLNIFFVNNEEKVIEVPYEGEVDEGSIWSPNDNVTFENNKFKVPVLTSVFTFFSNNVANEVMTNIIESVLNGEEIVENVEIVPEWAAFEVNEKYYGVDSIDEALDTEEELEVKLLKDTDLPTALEVAKKVTIDLNNCGLTVSQDTAGDGVFHVVEGGDLTINGDGLVDGVGKNKWNIVVFADGGDVTINGGTYTNVDTKVLPEDKDSDHFDVIYAKGKSKVIINGGYFEGKTPAWLLNLHDGSRETASITVKGGTFTGLNPADSDAEGDGTNFVAEGYKVIAYEDEYTVEPVEESDVILADGMVSEDLQTAVDTALKVKLLQDIDLETAVVVSTKVTLDLNGKTLTAKTDEVGDGIFKVVTGGDLTINGEGTIDSACQTNDYSMAIWATGEGKVTINGGTYTNKGAKAFEDDGVTPNNNELIYASGSGQIIINGGKFTGNTENTTYGVRYALNLKDTSKATITVKGGTFTGYDPANSASENPRMNFVAEGYEVTVENNEYTVVKKAN